MTKAKKVYISVFGSGMGHASRMAVVAREFREAGCDVMFSSSGEVTRWFRSMGYRCNDLPLVDVIFTAGGSFSAKETAKFSPLLFARFYKQVGSEARNLRSYAPDVVVSDSMLSTVIASKLLGLRTVSILNQLRLESSPGTPRIAAQLLSTGSITMGNTLWELSERIMLPDLPPPFTISEKNLWNAGSASRRAEYIGFLTSPPSDLDDPLTTTLDGERRKNKTRKKKSVYWQISGPTRTRATFLAKAREAAKALREEYAFFISAGDPMGSRVPREIEGGYEYGWCAAKDRLIDVCDYVVTRAGHVTISELILKGKAPILVPIPSQSEQLGNASKADRLGIAIKLEETELVPQLVRKALERLTDDEGFRKRVDDVEAVAKRFNPVREIIRAAGCS